ncbi:metal-sulfur cluster assembly factor [candidate division KSB1 bacterium]
MVTKEQVQEALSRCYDPEIPIVSVIDLGLIYDVAIDNDKVDITMTLTAPGCPMSTQIAMDVKKKVEMVDGVSEANVQVVWDPPWTPERLTDEAKKKLGYV